MILTEAGRWMMNFVSIVKVNSQETKGYKNKNEFKPIVFKPSHISSGDRD